MQTTNQAHDDYYHQIDNIAGGSIDREVLTINLSNLPYTANEEFLKQISGAKHIVSCVVDTDTIRNQCTGTGSFSCRLGHGETSAQILQRFQDYGFGTSTPEGPQGKKNNYTDISNLNLMDSHMQTQER